MSAKITVVRWRTEYLSLEVEASTMEEANQKADQAKPSEWERDTDEWDYDSDGWSIKCANDHPMTLEDWRGFIHDHEKCHPPQTQVCPEPGCGALMPTQQEFRT